MILVNWSWPFITRGFVRVLTPHSSDICKKYKHCGIAKAHHIFRTKNKNIGGVGLRQEKAFLLSAGGEELSAFVEGRTCLHYFHLLHQAEPTHLGERSEGSGSGHGCPLDVVVGLLVLQLPHQKNCRCGRNAFDLLPKYSNIALYGAPALQDVQLTSW